MLQAAKVKKYSYIDYESGLKAEHSLSSCFEKEFGIVSALTKEPLHLEVPELSLDLRFSKIKHWRVMESIFKQYSCLEHPYCKQCCTVKFWKLFLNQSDKGDKKVDILVNGKVRTYYCDDSNYSDSGCKYLTPEHGCCVHEFNPIHCMLPLIYFDRTEKNPEVVNIKKRVFGRNHIVGCPVSFREYKKFEDFESDTISRFKRLKQYYEDLGIDSYIDDVIAHLYRIGQREISRRLL